MPIAVKAMARAKRSQTLRADQGIYNWTSGVVKRWSKCSKPAKKKQYIILYKLYIIILKKIKNIYV